MTCGIGNQTRTRTCVKKDNFHTYVCEGESIEQESKHCNMGHCSDILSQWTSWSECSATCGPGFQNRKRRCINPGYCPPSLGPLKENRRCVPYNIGTYGKWSDWSQCERII